jgi:hypothetical protein
VLASFVAARAAAERDEEGSLALAEALVARKASARCWPCAPRRRSPTAPSRSASGAGGPTANWRRRQAGPGRGQRAAAPVGPPARGENRFDEAADYLERARSAAAAGSWRVLLSDMRLAQARGADALASRSPGAPRRSSRACARPWSCATSSPPPGLGAQADQLGDALSACPGQDARRADHLRLRGDLAGARALFAGLAAATPLDATPAQAEAALALAQDKPLEAAAVYERLSQAWPRHPLFHKKRAEALDRAGDPAGARAARELALQLDGSDLRLRRALAIEDGREPLDELKVDARRCSSATRRPRQGAAHHLRRLRPRRLGAGGAPRRLVHRAHARARQGPGPGGRQPAGRGARARRRRGADRAHPQGPTAASSSPTTSWARRAVAARRGGGRLRGVRVPALPPPRAARPCPASSRPSSTSASPTASSSTPPTRCARPRRWA